MAKKKERSSADSQTNDDEEKLENSKESNQLRRQRWTLTVFPPDMPDEDIAAAIRAQAKAAKEAREAKKQPSNGESGDQGTDAAS